MFKSIKEQLRYRIDNLFARGSSAQFLLLGVLTISVLLLGMLVYFFGLFGKENQEIDAIQKGYDAGFIDTFWWSLKHVLDPGFFADDYGASMSVIIFGILVTIMGLVIFGILIGFISTAIEERLDSLKKGNSLVKESGHILILGWNNKIFAILKLLIDYEKKLKVVILSNHDIEYMQEMIRISDISHPNIKTILRTGSPNNITELKRVAFHKAGSIIVLADESGENEKENPDIKVIKSLMVLNSFKDWHSSKPNIVAELQHKENYEVANIAGSDNIPIVTSSEIISKIVVQSSRQPGLSTTYAEIFSFAGNEIYVQKKKNCIGKTFGEILFKFPNAIAIGLSSSKKQGENIVFKPMINPKDDYVIKENENIILIAEDDTIPFDDSIKVHKSTIEEVEKFEPKGLEKILILGWNKNIYDILKEFDEYVRPNTELNVIASYTKEEASELIKENIQNKFEKINFIYTQGDYVKREVLDRLPISELDCVVILADESSEEEDPDARTIMSLILLRDIQKKNGTN